MKQSTILRFFAIVVAVLAVLCVVFPRDGIGIGGITLRFPSLHSVLVRERSKDIDEMLVKHTERDLSGMRDSLDDCYQVLFVEQTRFWLPGDDVSLFDNFFKAAESAVADSAIVRVMHYGDSQIEMDRMTGRMRQRLQDVFGGGGPGMLPLRQPVPTHSFNQSVTGSIEGLSTWGDNSFARCDGYYGPMLRSWRLTGSATMSLMASKGPNAHQRAGEFSQISLLFDNRPGPLTVSMRNRKGPGAFSGSEERQGVTSSAELRLTGTADIYGVMVDNGPGVAVDNVGMRSTSGHQFKMVRDDLLAQAYAQANVRMIIMQFGGNSVPYLKSEKAISNYCRKMGEQIDHVRKACPQAVILFVGPSDMSTMVGGRLDTYPYLPNVVDGLRDTVNAHGAAFWSVYDAMGGKGSMIVWNKNGYAGSDYIHFTTKGVNIMGDYLSDALLKMYELYQLRHKLTAEQFDRLWGEVRHNNKVAKDGAMSPTSPQEGDAIL